MTHIEHTKPRRHREPQRVHRELFSRTGLCAFSVFLCASVASTVFYSPLAAQAPRVEFEAVSIKPHDVSASSVTGMRLLQDGTAILTNVTMMTVLGRSTTVPARDIVGVPEWVNSERYDINAKAQPGERRDQERQRQMWRAMLEDRTKLVTHTEQRERDIYALVLARKDGKLGPQLKPSTLDCSSPQAPTAFTPAQAGRSPESTCICNGAESGWS